MNEEWRGGDMERDPGGGQKVNIIKKGIEKYKDDEDLIVVFTDRSVLINYLCEFFIK